MANEVGQESKKVESKTDKVRCRTTEDGFEEYLDEQGNVVGRVRTGKTRGITKAKRKKKDGSTFIPAAESVHKVKLPDGRDVWVQKGMNADAISKSLWPYSEIVAETILRLVSEGKLASEIGKIEGCPPAWVIHKWKREKPDFHERYKEAEQVRAEIMKDRILETIEAPMTKDEVPAARLKMDGYKYLAGIDDPDKFAKEGKGAGSGGVTIIVNTGIPTDPLPTAIETQGRTLDEKAIESEVVVSKIETGGDSNE